MCAPSQRVAHGSFAPKQIPVHLRALGEEGSQPGKAVSPRSLHSRLTSSPVQGNLKSERGGLSSLSKWVLGL